MQLVAGRFDKSANAQIIGGIERERSWSEGENQCGDHRTRPSRHLN
jgi:hypothetical protein